MIATNHALTGALIGLSVGNPVTAVPIAFASHYVLDVIPHFGKSDDPNFIKTRAFRNYLIVDTLLCVALVVVLGLTQPHQWLLAAVCAFIATLPDLMLIPRYIAAKQHKPYSPGVYNRFATRIQTYEKPLGSIVELVWATACIWLLVQYI